MPTRTQTFSPLILTACLLTYVLCVPAADDTARSRELNAYSLIKGPLALTGIQDNLSGITWCRTTKTLFAVQNGPTQITELTPDGEVKRTIALSGFDDTEGIAWLGGLRFAVVEERVRQLVIFELKPETTSVSHDTARTLSIEAKPEDKKKLNKGLEGITFVPKADEIFICVEKIPRKIYRLKLTDTPKPSEPWDAQRNGLGLSDLAGMAYDETTEHLLLLSDESKALVEITVDGKEVSRLQLGGGTAGLDAPVPQPEGVTLADDGKLYIVSEPNLLYIFAKQ